MNQLGAPERTLTSAAENRSAVIDGLRCLAAVAVALFHFNEPYDSAQLDDWYHRAAKYGHLGVPVFFVISGYCVMHARRSSSIGVFLKRRLLRIFPPYWASLLLIAGVGLLIQLKYGIHNQRFLPTSPTVLLGNIFCIAGPSGIQTINEVSWTLTYELGFYFIVALMIPKVRNPAILVISIVALLWTKPPFPLDLWGTFAMGLSCALFRTSKWMAAAVFSVAACQVGLQRGLPELTAGLLGVGVVLLPWAPRTSVLTKALAWGGALSYSLYLIHVPVAIYLQRVILGGYIPAALPLGIVKDVALLTFSFAVAYVFYRFVEKPSHDYARRISANVSVANKAGSLIDLTKDTPIPASRLQAE